MRDNSFLGVNSPSVIGSMYHLHLVNQAVFHFFVIFSGAAMAVSYLVHIALLVLFTKKESVFSDSNYPIVHQSHLLSASSS